MATEILMPALSPSSGDILAEIETDKATMEFEAVDEGTIGKILVAEGSEGVKVNTAIAVLVEDGESADDIVATPTTQAAPAPTQAATRRHRDALNNRARSAARRHGRGNAPHR